MVDVRTIRCVEENCQKQPSFNFDSETKEFNADNIKSKIW